MATDANEDALLAPTLATTFLGCRRAAAWDLDVRRGVRASPAAPAGQAALLSRKGMEHEQACREALCAEYGAVVDVAADGGFAARLARTEQAMAAGAPVIAQGAVKAGRWTGYADFLVRVEEPGAQWDWSYEPWDAKLAQAARPEHLLQLCLYADMLGAVQGRVPRHGRLLLGGAPDGAEAAPECRPFRGRVLASFTLADFRHYARRIARGLEHFADQPTGQEDDPDPCAACPTCRWREDCAELWDAHDHLCRVADITRLQMRRLRAAGIDTMAALAALDPAARAGAHIPKLNPGILGRLTDQARLQTRSEAENQGLWRALPTAPGHGFDRLPVPDPGDLFFDFEGDPLYPGGLEYLCGVLWREPGEAEPVFRAFWAEDRNSERHAFDGLMRFIGAHLTRHPAAHLYHYAPYERSALTRLASMHALHEEAVDDLLRQGRMIDLYRVVREALLIGERSYSIKALERFYMGKRQTQVVSGGDSVVAYDHWRRTGAESIRRDIEAYNRDDCLSTLGLRDWLLRIRPPAEPTASEAATDGDAPTEPEDDDRRQKREEAAAAQAAIEARLVDCAPEQSGYRRRVADLVGFHRREAKPGWWAFFDRHERTAEELVDDGECLGGLAADGADWVGEDKRSNTFRYRFPAQETKLRPGTQACIAGLPGRVTIHALDEDGGIVVLKRGKTQPPLPQSVSVIPDKPIDVGILSTAVRAVAEAIAEGRGGVGHIEALLRRDPPNLAGRAPGLPLVEPRDAEDPARLLTAAEEAVAALDQSWLFIQGPPGAGKTYLSSHLILAMLRQGKRVGVSSNSHKAIANLLEAVETRADEAGFTTWHGQNRTPDDWQGRRIARSASGQPIDPDADLLAGTAWLFARPELQGNRDILFVDEAGQVSLGHLIAMARGARNIVLIGDQMQLGQPIQGAHPGESGLSVLDFLLGDAAIIPPERGIFLPITWRMHPDLCRFVSNAVYEGRLHSEAGCTRQRLVLTPDAHPALKPTGLGFVAVAHDGNGQRSTEEADAVVAIYRSLLDQRVVDRHGAERPIAPDDILVIAPYNMQVNLLRRRLGAAARVGTVDRFQGQEAEVVLVSMTTSGAEDMPRDVSFLLSRNRLNVALSRARCLAVMVASPGLLDMPVRTVEEMRLANLLCWAKDYADAQTPAGTSGPDGTRPQAKRL